MNGLATARQVGARGLLVALIPCVLVAPGEASTRLAGMPLEHAIAVLENEGLRVFYSTDLVRPSMRVEAEPREATPDRVLAAILEPHGLTTRAGPQDSLLVVRDSESGERPAERAAETVTKTGAAAGGAGDRPLEELVVAATRYELRRPVGTSRVNFGSRDLEQLPDLGEDAMRAVTRLPGTASSAFSARPHIRGGALDETLVRIDGLRLYDPFHLKDFQGLFSIIDPRIARSMEIYTGGYPAALGDRLSGVVDIETISPADSLYHELGLSFFTLSALSSGRFGDGRGEWVVSARRSNLDLLYDRFSERPERPRYQDAFGKIGYALGDAWTVSARVLRSEDDITLADDLDREEAAEAHYSDRYGWVTLEYAPANGPEGSITLAQAALDSLRRGVTAKEGISAGALRDRRSFTIETLVSDWTWRSGSGLELRAGGSLERADGRYVYEDRAEYELLFDLPGAVVDAERAREIRIDPSGRRSALYADVRYRFGARVTAELGLRWTEHRLAGLDTETLDPRLGLRYRLNDAWSLRASWGRYHQTQAINELAVGDGESTFGAPERADHAVLGFDARFSSGLKLRLDAYSKRMSRLRPRYENLLNSQVLLPELKPDRFRIAAGSATARGIELMLESAPGPVQWWAGLSHSRVRDVTGEARTLRSWDQTNALTAGLVWDTPKWNVSTALLYHSGWPTTPVALDETVALPVVRLPNGRNSERLSAYRTLDLRITRKIELARSSLAVSLELANARGRDNACCFEFELGVEPDEPDGLLLDPLEYLPTIPSLGVLWKF